MAENVEVVQGRNCQGCTLCCKLLRVEELNKPHSVWCGSCDQRSGCKIYEDRPSECRDFYCRYLLDEALDERWKPSKSKLVVTIEERWKPLEIHVDSTRPYAWLQEPFYSQIQEWARAAAQQRAQVIVWQGDTKIIVSPTGDKAEPGEEVSDPIIVLA